MRGEIFGKRPEIRDAYVDITAVVIGDVLVEDDVGIYPNTTIRADDDRIVLKRGAMILDNCVVEAPRGHPVVIGERAIISHGAIVHGARVERHSVVGTGAVILDGSVVGENSLIAAGAVVTPGTKIPRDSVVAGIPGKVVRSVDEKLAMNMARDYDALSRKLDEYRRVRGILSNRG